MGVNWSLEIDWAMIAAILAGLSLLAGRPWGFAKRKFEDWRLWRDPIVKRLVTECESGCWLLFEEENDQQIKKSWLADGWFLHTYRDGTRIVREPVPVEKRIELALDVWKVIEKLLEMGVFEQKGVKEQRNFSSSQKYHAIAWFVFTPKSNGRRRKMFESIGKEWSFLSHARRVAKENELTDEMVQLFNRDTQNVQAIIDKAIEEHGGIPLYIRTSSDDEEDVEDGNTTKTVW